MPTTIQRRTTNGPSTAPRVPFPTPGRAPEMRVSALSLQGGQGVAVPTIPSVGSIETPPLTQLGSGVPSLSLYAGLPQLQFSSPTVGLAGGSAPAWRTILAILRVGDLHTAGNVQIARGAAGVGMSLNPAGELGIYGGGASGRSPLVKVASYPPRPQFLAIVLNGASSLVQVDDARAVVSTDIPTTPGPLYLGSSSGVTGSFNMQITEIEAHTAVLTPAQLDEKRAHYRALYQF